MVIVLLYRVTFQASCKGSHFEIGKTTDMSMRNTISEPTNQTKVLQCVRKQGRKEDNNRRNADKNTS